MKKTVALLLAAALACTGAQTALAATETEAGQQENSEESGAPEDALVEYEDTAESYDEGDAFEWWVWNNGGINFYLPYYYEYQLINGYDCLLLYDRNGAYEGEVDFWVNRTEFSDQEYSDIIDQMEEKIVQPMRDEGMDIQSYGRYDIASHPGFYVDYIRYQEDKDDLFMSLVCVNNEDAGMETVIYADTVLDCPDNTLWYDFRQMLSSAEIAYAGSAAPEGAAAEEEVTGDGQEAPAAEEEAAGDGQETPDTEEEVTGDGQEAPAAEEEAAGDGQKAPAAEEEAAGDGQEMPAAEEEITGGGQEAPAAEEEITGGGEPTAAEEEITGNDTVSLAGQDETAEDKMSAFEILELIAVKTTPVPQPQVKEPEQEVKTSQQVTKQRVEPNMYRMNVVTYGNLTFEIPDCLRLAELKTPQPGNAYYEDEKGNDIIQFYVTNWNGTVEEFKAQKRKLVSAVSDAYGGEIGMGPMVCPVFQIQGFRYFIDNVEEQHGLSTLLTSVYINAGAGKLVYVIYREPIGIEKDFFDVYLHVCNSLRPANNNLTVDVSQVTPAFKENMDICRNVSRQFYSLLDEAYRSGQSIGVQFSETYNQYAAEFQKVCEYMDYMDVDALNNVDRLYYDQTLDIVDRTREYQHNAPIGSVVSAFGDPVGNVVGNVVGGVASDLFGDSVGSLLGQLAGGAAGSYINSLGGEIAGSRGDEWSRNVGNGIVDLAGWILGF